MSSRTFTSIDSAPSEALLDDGIFMSSNGGISDAGIGRFSSECEWS